MIATGGLLRMNRRQDSLRSKNRAENKRKRKSKKKKKSDMVVVKGKLKLCSPAGLVAAVGVAVLLVGVSMAVLGYWPSRSQLEYQERRRTGLFHHSKGGHPKGPSDSTPNAPTDEPGGGRANGSSAEPRCGILCDFLDAYLYSDSLKVFGPLVMGIGIFLFICANAVLHENRDKKTKVINLRDIYSTVIDLHSLRAKERSPLNGLVNYSQARSAEGPSAGARGSWPSAGLPPKADPEDAFRRASLAGGGARDAQTFTDTVYSIYKDYSRERAPQPRPWETTSIVASSVNAFTLPVIKLNNCEVEEAQGAEQEARAQEGVVIERSDETGAEQALGAPTGSPPPHLSPEEAESADQQRAPQAQQPVAVATGSNASLDSPVDEPRLKRRCSLSACGGRQGDRTRRFSCPRLERSNSRGYIKLADLGGESFEGPEAAARPPEGGAGEPVGGAATGQSEEC